MKLNKEILEVNHTIEQIDLVLEFLARAIRQEEKNKINTNR
jgi:hypothetical protein